MQILLVRTAAIMFLGNLCVCLEIYTNQRIGMSLKESQGNPRSGKYIVSFETIFG